MRPKVRHFLTIRYANMCWVFHMSIRRVLSIGNRTKSVSHYGDIIITAAPYITAGPSHLRNLHIIAIITTADKPQTEPELSCLCEFR